MSNLENIKDTQIKNPENNENAENEIVDIEPPVKKPVSKPKADLTKKTVSQGLEKLKNMGETPKAELGKLDELKATLSKVGAETEWHKIDLGHGKVIEVRKWKAKDRRAFRNELSKILQDDALSIMKATFTHFVFNCMKTKVPLSLKELKYVFPYMRIISIGEKAPVRKVCGECMAEFVTDVDLREMLRPVIPENIDGFTVEGIEFKLKEPEFDRYNKILFSSQYSEVAELVYRIDTINGKSYSVKDIFEVFESLDTDVVDTIIENLSNSTFDVESTCEITCPYCGYDNEYEFDEIPNLLPQEWLTKG